MQDTTKSSAAPTASDAVTLTTDRTAYRPGDNLSLTLTNPTASNFTYSACARKLEHEAGGAWTEVFEDRMCPMIAYLLGPKATRTDQTDISAGVPAGRYRVVLALSENPPSGASRSVRVASAPITVTR